MRPSLVFYQYSMVGNIARNIAEEGIIPSRLDITATEMVEMCSVYETSYDIDCLLHLSLLYELMHSKSTKFLY